MIIMHALKKFGVERNAMQRCHSLSRVSGVRGIQPVHEVVLGMRTRRGDGGDDSVAQSRRRHNAGHLSRYDVTRMTAQSSRQS